MAEETSNRAAQIRRVSNGIANQIYLAVNEHTTWSSVVDALCEALAIVGAGVDTATGERDERIRDLDALTAERDAAQAEATRLMLALAKERDAHDIDGRALVKATAEIETWTRSTKCAERRANQAEAELEKTRALVDELREQLAAPTVQSAAVEKWLRLPEHARQRVSRVLRAMLLDWQTVAADALDSLAMQAPASPTQAGKPVWYVLDKAGFLRPVDPPSSWDWDAAGSTRAGVPTEAADEVERLRRERDSLKACNERQRETIVRLQSNIETFVAAADHARGE